MQGFPVSGNVDAPADPDAVVALQVIQEPLQCGEAPGPAKQPAVHADRHHLGMLGAFGVEHVERVAQVFEKMACRVEPCGVAKRMSFASSV